MCIKNVLFCFLNSFARINNNHLVVSWGDQEADLFHQSDAKEQRSVIDQKESKEFVQNHAKDEELALAQTVEIKWELVVRW